MKKITTKEWSHFLRLRELEKEQLNQVQAAEQEVPVAESTSGAEAALPTEQSISDEIPAISQELYSSPYTEPPFELIIGPSNTVHYVPRHLVPQEWRETGAEGRFYLPSVNETTGHTIVHYLYTKSFEALAATGSYPSVGFTQALLVYIATAECSSLGGLEAAAVHEMEGHGSDLSIFEVLSATENHFSKLTKKSWVHDYLPKRAREAFEENHGIFKTEAFLESIGGAEFYRFMMTCAVDLYDDKISRMIETEKEMSQELDENNRVLRGHSIQNVEDHGDLNSSHEDLIPHHADEDTLDEISADEIFEHDALAEGDLSTFSCSSSNRAVDVLPGNAYSVDRYSDLDVSFAGLPAEVAKEVPKPDAELDVPSLDVEENAGTAVLPEPEPEPTVDPFAGLSKSQKKKLRERMKKEAADTAFEENRLRIEPDAVERCLAPALSAPELIPDAAMSDPGHMLSDDALARQIQMIQKIVADAFERERQRVAAENA